MLAVLGTRDRVAQLAREPLVSLRRLVSGVHSISMEVPDHLIPVFPAYEERFLCLVLSLLRSRRSRVVYVTSQPILPRLLDYYFGLVPELGTPEARSRFSVVSLVDGRNLPLTRKLLARPDAIERIRALVAQPELAFLLPFATSPDEVELAVRLGIPLYGADPTLEWLGTKTGSRRVFAEEGVPHARGFDVGGERDVLRALSELRSATAIVKLDRGVSGLGNAPLPRRSRVRIPDRRRGAQGRPPPGPRRGDRTVRRRLRRGPAGRRLGGVGDRDQPPLRRDDPSLHGDLDAHGRNL